MKRGQERLTLLADELRKGNDRVFTEIYEMTQQGLHVYALMLMKDPEKTQPHQLRQVGLYFHRAVFHHLFLFYAYAPADDAVQQLL